MKFSILIAHYNNFEYFQDCYKSILAQTYKNFEVIILDDNSTDGSFEKLNEFLQNDDRFKIFQNKENKGVGYTKGKLIELSIGDICGFLDPDDTLMPNAIQMILEAYQKYPNIIATYSKFYICDKNLQNCKVFTNTKKIKNGNPLFFNINLEVAHFFTFKRKYYTEIEKIGETYRVSEDQDLYLKLYEKGNFYLINEPILKYRLHSKGLSHDTEKIKERNNYWHKVLENTLKRRNISKLYGKKVEEIENLPQYIFTKQNTLIKRVLRKLF